MSNNIYSDFGAKELKAGYWWVTHRVMIRQAAYVFLSVLAAGFLFFGVGGLLKFYLLDRAEHRNLESEIAKPKLNYEVLAEINTPKNLAIAETWVLRIKEGSYDFAAEVSNLNTKWFAKKFDYYFVFGEKRTPVQKAFALPDQTKYLLNLNFVSDQPIREANLIIENIEWQKVDDDFLVLKSKMLNIEITDLTVVSAQNNSASDKENISSVSFAAINKSNYNYWQPNYTVLLYKKDDLLAVGSLSSPKLDSKERRVESLNLFQYLPSGVEVKVIPDINVLDPLVFKSFEVEQDLR